jgi:tRNA(Ile)-lysidine synthase
MNVIWPKPGKYVVAVSGGVDSVALLNMLASHGEYELVVAHVDHGIRSDSSEDTALVQQLAQDKKFNIVITKLNFTNESSENELRQARYDFLFEVMRDHNAEAIITAHHLDDVIETSIMNVRRGTDRYGAAGGMTRQGIIRPLINLTKQQLIDYANEYNLQWCEDNTNSDTKYTRNNIRHNVVPKINRVEYLKHVHALQDLNTKIDLLLKGRTSIEPKIVHLAEDCRTSLSLRELEVLIAYGLRKSYPNIDLNQRRISQAAREIMLGADKISFSMGGTDGIIVEIQ